MKERKKRLSSIVGHVVKSKVHRKWLKKDGREEESDKVIEKLRERERERERE